VLEDDVAAPEVSLRITASVEEDGEEEDEEELRGSSISRLDKVNKGEEIERK
jgi:hypothetical protein